MVEINNQRKAFLDMLAWSEGTDNGRQKNQKSWLWRHCRRRAITDYSDHSSQTYYAKPKTQINRRRTPPASFLLVDVTAQLGLKDFSPKVRTLWHCSRLRSGALPGDWSWWYPSGNRPLRNIWASLPGAGYGQFEHKADSPIAKFKEAGGIVREIDVWAECGHLRSAILHHRLPVMGC